MTEDYGTCDIRPKKGLHKKSAVCMNWKPLEIGIPHVIIWRYDERTLTVACGDGSCWNSPDTMFTGARHEGVWSSREMRFVPRTDGCDCAAHRDSYFSDGVPVERYEGLQ